MTKTNVVTQCCVASGILILVSMFSHLISVVNSYDNAVENNSHVISAFNG